MDERISECPKSFASHFSSYFLVLILGSGRKWRYKGTQKPNAVINAKHFHAITTINYSELVVNGGIIFLYGKKPKNCFLLFKG